MFSVQIGDVRVRQADRVDPRGPHGASNLQQNEEHLLLALPRVHVQLQDAAVPADQAVHRGVRGQPGLQERAGAAGAQLHTQEPQLHGAHQLKVQRRHSARAPRRTQPTQGRAARYFFC